MSRQRLIVGRDVQGERPDWRPLARVVGEELMASFMWMYEIRTSAGGQIHAYKHIDTREYVHLDTGGNAYLYVDGDRYRRVGLADALELALRAWWERLGATPEETVAAWEAIERARRAEE